MKSDYPIGEAVEIRILLAMISRIATHDQERRLASFGFGSSLQHIVMRLIGHHGHTISELSRTLMLEPATLVPVIDALERDGYARRNQDPKDRRRTPVLLTDRGTALLAHMPVIDDADTLVSSLVRLGDKKAHQLLVLLRELATYVSKDQQAIADIESTVQQHFMLDARSGASAGEEKTEG